MTDERHDRRFLVIEITPGHRLEIVGARLTRAEADRLADRTGRAYAVDGTGYLSNREREALRRWER